MSKNIELFIRCAGANTGELKRIGAGLGITSIALLSLVLSACAVGPDYKKPELAVPTAYKENAGWRQAAPNDAIKRGAWWEIYGDGVLNDLEQQVNVSNQSLKQAEAQYRQAAALVSSARASYFPTVSAGLTATRQGSYSNSSSGVVSDNGSVISGSGIHNSFQAPLSASWEPDLWGSVRRTVEGDVASAQASEATLENTRLSLQATLAQTYFQLRIVDEQKRLLDDTVKGYQRSLQLTQNQYNVGVAARADVVTAETQLKTGQVQQIALGVSRAQYEHAIAMLIGKTPAEFSLAPAPFKLVPPPLPIDVPATLLERRPDVAVAERQAAQANAQIGVAEAAWFPTITLSGSYGYSNSAWSQLFEAPSRVWSIGPKLAETIFDGGARRAQTAQARAAFDAAAANYRQVALAAFQNVEDNLAALRILEQEAVAQDDAVKSAEQALAIAINQYRAGTQNYLYVITAQNTAYSNEQNAITILGTRLSDHVALIKALGGGWKAEELPAASEISRRSQAPSGSAKE
jgi:NodT family efflux transporter outer membrane factor (OMF) lipoprotein